MNKPFRPMLAAEADFSKLRFPCIASPKLDGVRALIRDGVVMSRSMKPIRNAHVQALFGRPELEGLDGELIVGTATAEDVYRVTQSAVNSSEGEPDVSFFVFDRWDLKVMPYAARYQLLQAQTKAPGVLLHYSNTVTDLEELAEVENRFLNSGYEGVILRDPTSVYKQGRSTVTQGALLKLKRFQDSEARIVDVEELLHNTNEATTNELGRTARSSHKENQVPGGTMGAILVEDIHTGVQFRIGTGFTAEERKKFWELAAWLKSTGVLVKYKFFPVGVKELPRHPVYLGLRDASDLGGE